MNALQSLSKAQMTQQPGRTGRTDEGDHITMMSYDQDVSQVWSSDLAQLEESDVTPMILRSLVASTTPSGAAPRHREDVLTWNARQGSDAHGAKLQDAWTYLVTGRNSCSPALRGLEESAIILITTCFKEGPAMTQQFCLKHGHRDGDLLTSILAYQWFVETRAY